MTSRFFKTLLLAGVIVGGIWILSNRDKISEPGDVVELIKDQLAVQVGVPSGTEFQPPDSVRFPSPQRQVQQSPRVVTNVIRIASFRLNRNITGQQSAAALEVLARICCRYDAIAFQGIETNDGTWLSRLTDRMNAFGTSDAHLAVQNRPNYAFISDEAQNEKNLPADSAIGRSAIGQSAIGQSAIVFNRRTLELGQSQWYTVNDPDDILSGEPLVAWFRTRGPAADQAFTFSLVNVKINEAQPDLELAYVGELFRAIRGDGRGEDDVLIVGDFHAGERGQPMRKRAGLTWVVSNRPTNRINTSQFDNLVFNEMATVEFTGRGGVFDFMRHFNMRLDDARMISEHMPVWAEFSVFEGAALPAQRNPSTMLPGRVADGESSTQR